MLPAVGSTLDPLQLSRDLQEMALELTDKFASADGSRVNYKKLRRSAEFQGIVITIATVLKCDMDTLDMS
jgi:hypothetical protein